MKTINKSKLKNKKKFNHLTLDDRNIIEEELNIGSSFKEISRIIKKDASSISKEIKRNFSIVKPSTFNNSFNKCEFKRTCQLKNICIDSCRNLL